MFRRPISFIGTLNKTLSRAFNASARSEAVSQKLLSLRVISLPPAGCQLSCITQRKVNYLISMQPVPEKTTSGGQQEPQAKQSGAAVRKEPKAGSEKKKKVKKVKGPIKGRGRKQREKESEATENLLAELPFANTEIWKELGFAGGETSAEKKRKRAAKGRAESEEDGEKEKKKKKGSPRPNYFVSIPITNQKIKQAVEELQADILQKEPRLSRALIPVGTLHITLLVTHLATPEEVHAAAAALEEMQPTLRALLGGRSLTMPFRGIGHFRQEVAFIKIEEGEHLSALISIADSVRRAFEEKGVSSGDQKDFKPHLTFIKLSRAPKLRRQGIRKLDAALYAPFEQREFGEESVCTLDLCSMLKKKSADGYYHREKTVTFGAKGGPELDDEELVSLSKRLVEDAVFRAVQQYMEETQQNGAAPKDEAPPPLTTNK
ncbi:A-kinase anchor protein 7 isoform X3 [Pygocentrus nattereri]|uniref:A-kinase anchoring protein 7 n=1 Tax=Pygocentrus nattereri TaxID=42514 RepID=A0A3B4CIS4_PYGNA|nr:A-kinase anchor protein 7 isoform X3 [Pygocentrus nattereri]